jgi:hypothetical protein
MKSAHKRSGGYFVPPVEIIYASVVNYSTSRVATPEEDEFRDQMKHWAKRSGLVLATRVEFLTTASNSVRMATTSSSYGSVIEWRKTQLKSPGNPGNWIDESVQLVERRRSFLMVSELSCEIDPGENSDWDDSAREFSLRIDFEDQLGSIGRNCDDPWAVVRMDVNSIQLKVNGNLKKKNEMS